MVTGCRSIVVGVSMVSADCSSTVSTTDGCIWGSTCTFCASGRGVAGGCHVARNRSITLLSALPKCFVAKIASTFTPTRVIPELLSYLRLLYA